MGFLVNIYVFSLCYMQAFDINMHPTHIHRGDLLYTTTNLLLHALAYFRNVDAIAKAQRHIKMSTMGGGTDIHAVYAKYRPVFHSLVPSDAYYNIVGNRIFAKITKGGAHDGFILVQITAVAQAFSKQPHRVHKIAR